MQTTPVRTVTRATVAAASVAAPVMVPTAAQAAPESAWDAVAQCESSGNWAINTGNGFYGGLQFTPSTWAAYKPAGAPARADLASKAQQVAAAEATLAVQGWNAWPVCSIMAGVRQYAPGGGVTPTPPIPAPTPIPSPRQELTAPAGDTYTVAPGDYLVKISARTGVPWRQIAAANNLTQPWTIYPGQVLQLDGPPAPADEEYTVQMGDWLSTIAPRFDLTWQQLYQANRDRITNPDVIQVGQVLTVPGGRHRAPEPTVAGAGLVAAPPAPIPVQPAVPPPPPPSPARVVAHISNTFGPVRPQTQAAADTVVTNVPGSGALTIGGTRPSAIDPAGHPSGLALDYMVLSNKALGDAIVAYHRAHWDELGVKYLIWQQRYLPGPDAAWQPMADRGSPTQNHFDHVHVNYR